MSRDSGYARAENNWYIEPDWIVRLLLKVETFSGGCLDPACGEGNIPKVLIDSGYECAGSELTDRGYGTVNTNFFDLTEKVDNIVSNPPYGKGMPEKFARHALMLARFKVALILPLAFLESLDRERFFRATPLARVWVSRRRVSMPPGGMGIVAKGGTKAYAWFVWEHGHRGRPLLGWI